MEISSQVIASRAVNSLPRLSGVGYVALKSLLKSIPLSKDSNFIEKYSSLVVPQSCRFQLYEGQHLKRFGENPVFRDVRIPSPSFALGEASAIRKLAMTNAWPLRSDVYSYRLAPPHSAYGSYEHFGGGYRQRNIDIGAALYLSNKNVAVISDVRSFYPSIEFSVAFEKFKSVVARTPLTTAEKDGVLAMASVLNDKSGGLSVGPMMSHLIADIYFTEVDSILRSSFKGGYFRYVDDLVVIANRGEEEIAYQKVQSIISDAGLSLGDEKKSFATFDEWKNPFPELAGETYDPFNWLRWAIKFFFATRPGSAPVLQSELAKNGFWMPTESLISLSRSKSWRSSVLNMASSGWHLPLMHYMKGIKAVIESALYARRYYTGLLFELFEQDVPLDGMQRKWWLSRAKYIINRSIYLCDNEILSQVLYHFEGVLELSETIEVIRSVVTENPERVLNMPGAAANAAAEQYVLRGLNLKNMFDQSSGSIAPKYHLDALAPFVLRGAVSDDNEKIFIEDSIVRWSSGLGGISNDGSKISWGDEVGALLKGKSSAERNQLFARKIMQDEVSPFEALSLSSGYYDE